MQYVGIFLIIISLPLFMSLLKAGPGARKWMFVAIGTLPVFAPVLNLDVALIDWAAWPGHTKGLIISLTDTAALAVCIRYAGGSRLPVLFWLWLAYLICNIPGLFVGPLITPASFYMFSIIRAAVYFYACYLIICNGGLIPLVNGLAATVIANAVAAIWSSLQGATQAAGLLGHQNHSGLMSNLAVPILLTIGMQQRIRPVMLLAVAGAGASAIAGASRAVVLLYGASLILTLLLNVLVRPDSRKIAVLVACLAGTIIAAPLAQNKLLERFHGSGSQFTLDKDEERERFEAAARMMIADHPFGVGHNQYTVTANAGGYADRAGVHWGAGSRSTAVHNSYLLARAEGGFIALLGLCGLLWTPLAVSLFLCFRRGNPLRPIAAAAAVAFFALSIHVQFEWLMMTVTPLYQVGLMCALTAAVQARAKRQHKAATRREAHSSAQKA
jgi:hypothetical protein